MFLSVAYFLMTVAYLALEHACSKDSIWDPCGNLVGGANNLVKGTKYTQEFWYKQSACDIDCWS